MDSKGNMTIELGLILVIILLITGIILSFTEMANEKIVKQEEMEHVETLIERTADNLINTPGNPDDWEKYAKGTPGLAIINDEDTIIPNSISYFKLIALKNNYNKLVDEKLFNSKIKTSMELIPQESIISSVKIGHEDEGKNVFSTNRLVICDFYKKYVIKDFKSKGKCNHNHKQDLNSCNYFKTFKGNLKYCDYYLIADEDEVYNLEYMVDTTKMLKHEGWQTMPSEKIYLNDKFDFYGDKDAIVFVHLNKKNPKAVIVSVPKDFDKNNLKYDYFRANECKFILKGWY